MASYCSAPRAALQSGFYRTKTGSISRRSVVVTASQNAPQPQLHARSVPVGTGFWLLDPLQDRYFNVHGPTFIIQRSETYAKIFPKLRQRGLHQRHHDIQVAQKPRQGSMALTRSSAAEHSDLPALFEGQPVIDVTQYLEEMEQQEQRQQQEEQSASAAVSIGIVSCSVMPGLVQVPMADEHQDQEGDQEVFIGSSSSPRRTKMVGFTCRRCNARTYRPVSPVSFMEGTLVVQCGKCERWHKIKDHLHLFHDMCGELFLRASPITAADLPESLRLPLDPFYWHEGN